jgi:uncharacterized protein YwqG
MPQIEKHRSASVAFWTMDSQPGRATHRSHLGGGALLPQGFRWPASKRRPLDFLLQIDLAAVAPFAPPGLLPDQGLLTFFYDLVNQQWGYDPAETDGARVVLVTDASVSAVPGPEPGQFLEERQLEFGRAETLPTAGSRAFDALYKESGAQLPDAYGEYQEAFERGFYPSPSGRHRLLGHSANVQGDMQLEAQLVTHGLYCGDASGYEDPRAAGLAAKADDWMLLLQLDSDDTAQIMWGDMGMLYFWIRREDLMKRRFDAVWMTLQCG